MNEERTDKLIKIVIGAIIVILALGLGSVMLHYRSNMQDRSQRIAALNAKAKDYETELNELRRQQEIEEMHLYTPEKPGAAVIAFLIDGQQTLARALSLGKTYGFTPAILLRTDEDKLDTVLGAITNSGLEVILYNRGFDNAGNVRAMHRRLDAVGCKNTYACLLRANDDTEQIRRKLARADITTLFLYGDSITSTITEEGTVELNYSYINKSSYNPSNRLSELSDSEQGLLFAFDLVETTVTDHQMEEILRMIREEADAGHITLGSVGNAVRLIQDRTEREAASVAEFLAAQQTRSARIKELEEMIKEIYSHWDD